MRKEMAALLFLLAVQAVATAPPAVALAQPRLTDQPLCDRPARESEIVVCGRSDRESPYRIAPEFRDRGPIDDQHQSHANRVRDFNMLQTFDGQTVGAGGAYRQSRQVECQWRAARQEAQGRQPDCTRRVTPDTPTDWQRR